METRGGFTRCQRLLTDKITSHHRKLHFQFKVFHFSYINQLRRKMKFNPISQFSKPPLGFNPSISPIYTNANLAPLNYHTNPKMKSGHQTSWAIDDAGRNLYSLETRFRILATKTASLGCYLNHVFRCRNDRSPPNLLRGCRCPRGILR
jgi:hypothetical protein